MKTFLVQFKWYKPYPKEMNIRQTASSMATAVARAMRTWKKEEGRGVKQLSINVSTL